MPIKSYPISFPKSINSLILEPLGFDFCITSPLGSIIKTIGLYLPRLFATFKSSPSTSIDANTKLSFVTSNFDSSIIFSRVLSIEINS